MTAALQAPHACRYETGKIAGEYDQEALKREQARNALERYMHYYQRWAENDASRGAARKEAEHAARVQLLELSEATATPTSQLKFICDAWDQVRPAGTPRRRSRASACCSVEP